MGFNQAPALPYRNLGIVEDGDTASQAIEKDKYIIWKGQNYFAKTDILQGETFVVDTNLTAMPEGVINGIVDTLNASLTPVSKSFVSTTSYFKFGNILKIGKLVAIFMRGEGNSSTKELATLPDDCLPADEYYNNNTSGNLDFPAHNPQGLFNASFLIGENSNKIYGYCYSENSTISGWLVYLTD